MRLIHAMGWMRFALASLLLASTILGMAVEALAGGGEVRETGPRAPRAGRADSLREVRGERRGPWGDHAPVGGLPSSGDPRIYVYVPESIEDPVRAVARRYEGMHAGTRVIVRADRPRRLAEDVLSRAERPDLIVTEDASTMDLLERAGVLLDGTRVELLENRLVVIGPVEGPVHLVSIGDLIGPRVRTIAIGDSLDPLFGYARDCLAAAGIWDAVLARALLVTGARAAVAAVEKGEADHALVYASDLRGGKHVRVVWNPDPASCPPIRYSLALLERSHRRPAAIDFHEYLRSIPVGRIFTVRGFHSLSIDGGEAGTADSGSSALSDSGSAPVSDSGSVEE